MRAPTVSCIVLTRNESKHIAACLETLVWADDLLVLDGGSADDTVARARQAGARVEERAWRDFPDQRNAALEMTPCDWVFFVDADERCTPAVAAEIRRVVGRGMVPDTAEAPIGYWIPRHNIILGKIIMHTGWYPDYQARLFRRGFGRFDPARVVHELPIFDGCAGYLTEPLIHYNYATVREFWAKQLRYADYDVRRLRDEGIRPRFWAPLVQPLRHFWWRFFTLQGYRDGGHGLLLSVLMAAYQFVVYSRLRAL
jgi:(heptosyl)LPS beta-1,4-glucosyltransferase